MSGIAYGVPDLDANVKVVINATNNPGVSLACVEANLSNGQTLDQKGVGWTTAVIAGWALVASADALSLFGYFQTRQLLD
jgi:hypothetical protein